MTTAAQIYDAVAVRYHRISLACLDKAHDLLAPCLIIHGLGDVDAKEVVAAVQEVNCTVK